MPTRSRANSRAFTLVEMIVVVTVLALVSAMVAPFLVSMKATSDRSDAVAAVRRFAVEARERAIRSAASVQIVYDDGSRELRIDQDQSDGTQTTLSRVKLPQGFEPQTFRIEGKDVTAPDFSLTFNPDGTSNGGGIEFPNLSVSVDPHGAIDIQEGQLPAPEDQSWQAGDLEKRG